MSRERSRSDSDCERLSPGEVTNRIAELEPGDEIELNNRRPVFEVVETQKHSVVVADPDGHTVVVSKNLQSGGWLANEDVWWVSIDSDGNT
ncbi:Uncharacterized protein AArcCO_2947 [Halalkaliarchaeum sp. AArc-CO]|uniref:transcriptional regulator n=1 Tax=Halalkaliarchaeum sp. AArc-CO TaxID=2866381 RepID=UPI00217DEB84|nr:transcriptional regulator [Halalkaliarchaeum sp. AArc-CO]UWG52219.1 Uncharacterized protein AArcCO_2947 [Halalkaliarchaeum sp. AArc-CO]